ncbi:MAG: S8 family peptidase [bacterium]|jgi:subtilisin|nr:S8 family peptidase [bacterium]
MTRSFFFILSLVLLVVAAQMMVTPVMAQDVDPVIESVAKKNPAMATNPMAQVPVLIQFSVHPGAVEANLVRAAGGNIKRQYRHVPVVAARIPLAALEHLRSLPTVRTIEEDGQDEVHDAELDNTWSVKALGAGDVHAQGIQGQAIKVAVLDTGIDYTHPDLAPIYAGGYDFVNEDSDPMDDHGHGTHVAGTIAAAENNSGVVGMAPAVRLYVLKTGSASGSFAWSDTIAALDWCISQGIQITNSSFGGSTLSSSMQLAYSKAEAAGILNLAAAGNSGTADGSSDTVLYPAKYDAAVAIASVDSKYNRASSSSTGSAVELAAFGVTIKSTLLGGGYGYKSGTSMACPHASGAAALVLSAGIQDANGNGRVNDELRSLLTSTAMDLGSSGRDTWYGFGCVDVRAAVNRVGVPQPTATPTPQPTMAPEPTNTPVPTPIMTPTPTVTPTPVVTPEPTATPVVKKTAKVPAVKYVVSGGKSNDKHLTVGIEVQSEDQTPLAGAVVTYEIYRDGKLALSGAATTQSTGMAEVAILNAKSGVYTSQVLAIQATAHEWDGQTPSNSFKK